MKPKNTAKTMPSRREEVLTDFATFHIPVTTEHLDAPYDSGRRQGQDIRHFELGRGGRNGSLPDCGGSTCACQAHQAQEQGNRQQNRCDQQHDLDHAVGSRTGDLAVEGVD